MPPPSKKPEENAENCELSRVEKKFYELTIADLNKKLITIRAQNANVLERNEELEVGMKQLKEDREDVNAYLNRTLRQNVVTINDLEEKLTELAKTRQEEIDNFSNQIKECEENFIIMKESLNSEIQSLKENIISMNESHEIELKEQAERMKYDIIRSGIMDKKRFRDEVEERMFEMSNEFKKTSLLQTAGSTQRLLRENIALNNEMDRMVATQNRLKEKNAEMMKARRAMVAEYDKREAEIVRLIKTCDQRHEVIEKLVTECENIKEQNLGLREVILKYEDDHRIAKVNEVVLKSLKEKIIILEQLIRVIDSDRQMLKSDAIYNRQELNRVSKIIKNIDYTVKSVITEQSDDDDAAFRDWQRKNLLKNLQEILEDYGKHGRKPSLQTIPSTNDFHHREDLGIIPNENVLKEPKVKLNSMLATPSIQSIEVSDDEIKSESYCELLDPVSATSSLLMEHFGFENDDSDVDLDEDSQENFNGVVIAADVNNDETKDDSTEINEESTGSVGRETFETLN